MIDCLRIYKTVHNETHKAEFLTDKLHRIISGDNLYKLLEEKLFKSVTLQRYPLLYNVDDIEKISVETLSHRLYAPGTKVIQAYQGDAIDFMFKTTITYAIELKEEGLSKFLEKLRVQNQHGLEERRIDQEYNEKIKRVKEKYLPQLLAAGKLREQEQKSNPKNFIHLAQQISLEVSDISRE